MVTILGNKSSPDTDMLALLWHILITTAATTAIIITSTTINITPPLPSPVWPMQALGNAATSRNDNSSRFGKYTSVHFNKAGRVVGCDITSWVWIPGTRFSIEIRIRIKIIVRVSMSMDMGSVSFNCLLSLLICCRYLLEKSRVTGSNARNYNVFYHMLVLASEERESFGDPLYLSNKKASDFRFCMLVHRDRLSLSMIYAIPPPANLCLFSRIYIYSACVHRCLFCVCIANADTWARWMRPVQALAPPLWQEASTWRSAKPCWRRRRSCKKRIATSECEGSCMPACAVCVDNRVGIVYDHDVCCYNFGFTATCDRLRKQRRVRLM